MDHDGESGREIQDHPSVLIVCEHASTRFGGEAILPWHYFRILRRRGIDARLVAHQRTRDELYGLLPDEADRMYFTPDTAWNKLSCRLGDYLPAMIGYMTLGYSSRLQTQWLARKLARRLVAEHRIDVVHQPIPVSPREPSLLFKMGAPVIIGPMNGNMTYPPAFARRGGRRIQGVVVGLGRLASGLLHRLIPGKLRAAALLVANERTRVALPKAGRGEVITLVENGVDLGLWSAPRSPSDAGGPTRYVFLGRLVDWKAVDVLLEAFARVRTPVLPRLQVIGDGPMRPALEDQARRLGVSDRVEFVGWLPQAECPRRLRESDVLVLPSLYECGGAVVLEAMACAIPVIATAWGGPMDYLDASCGILVPPDSREALVSGLVEAMSRLADDPGLRTALGRAGRERVEREFDWEVKVDRMLAIYGRVAARSSDRAPGQERPGVHVSQPEGHRADL
jgi:glycosyltransferase involved in cell wall biosynthesis